MRTLVVVYTGDIIHGQVHTIAILIIITIVTSIIIATIIIGGIQIITGIILILHITTHIVLQRKLSGAEVFPENQIMTLLLQTPIKAIQFLRTHKPAALYQRLIIHILQVQLIHQPQLIIKKIKARLNHVETITGNHYE